MFSLLLKTKEHRKNKRREKMWTFCCTSLLLGLLVFHLFIHARWHSQPTQKFVKKWLFNSVRDDIMLRERERERCHQSTTSKIKLFFLLQKSSLNVHQSVIISIPREYKSMISFGDAFSNTLILSLLFFRASIRGERERERERERVVVVKNRPSSNSFFLSCLKTPPRRLRMLCSDFA